MSGTSETDLFSCRLQYENILVQAVDMVISQPTDLNTTVGELNLTSLAGAFGSVATELPLAVLDKTPRLTVFGEQGFHSLAGETQPLKRG